MRPVPPGWGYAPPPGRRRPELGGVTVLILVTVLAALVAPHAQALRGKLADVGPFPAIRLPKPSSPLPRRRPGHPRG